MTMRFFFIISGPFHGVVTPASQNGTHFEERGRGRRSHPHGPKGGGGGGLQPDRGRAAWVRGVGGGVPLRPPRRPPTPPQGPPAHGLAEGRTTLGAGGGWQGICSAQQPQPPSTSMISSSRAVSVGGRGQPIPPPRWRQEKPCSWPLDHTARFPQLCPDAPTFAGPRIRSSPSRSPPDCDTGRPPTARIPRHPRRVWLRTGAPTVPPALPVLRCFPKGTGDPTVSAVRTT